MPPSERRIFLAVIVLPLLSGCGSGLKAGPRDSATGGVAMEILRSDERSSYALYRVDPDGSISFGGGRDAQQDQTTWTTVMTAEQIAVLRSLISDHGWLASAPAEVEGAPPADDDGLECRITFASPELSWRANVPAAHPRVEPVVEYLRELALTRHEHVLQSLPQPNQPGSGGE